VGCLGCIGRGGWIAALVALAVTIGAQGNLGLGVALAVGLAFAVGMLQRTAPGTREE
jgi:hypothetical protein